MRLKSASFLLIVLGLAVCTAACGRKVVAPKAAPPTALPVVHEPQSVVNEPTAQPGPTDDELLDQVGQRLRVVMDPLPDFVAPPAFELVAEDKINAYATAKIEGKGASVRLRPRVVVSQGMLDRVIRSKDDPDGDADRLALIVGHELSHVALGHVVHPPAGQTEFVRQAFTRKQENDADLQGMQLLLKAGYSFRRGRTAIDRMRDAGLDYSSFEGLGADHPTWTDRLSLMDKEQATLWQAMSAFQNGVFFLLVEQYASAEGCFRQVVQEFPQCYEAWTNLGDSLLMQYCDKLEADDLRQFNIGPLAVGGFYARPESLEGMVRGQDKGLWNDAVEALGRALRLSPDLALAKADLGLAYLVSPHGQDLNAAARYLEEGARSAAADQAVHPLMRAAVLANAAVGEMAAGRSDAAARRLDEAEAITRRVAAEDGRPHDAVTWSLSCGLLYNRAVLLAASADKARQRQAAELFAEYLQTAEPASAWWPLAQERYAKLCRDLGLPANGKMELARRRRAGLLPLTSVQLGSGERVTLSEPLVDVRKRLGEGQAVPVIRGTDLVRVYYPEQGVELLCRERERVLAICLRGPKAPPLPVKSVGAGGAARELRVRMKKADLEKALANQPHDVRELDDPKVGYVYYPGLRLAVRWRGGSVEELVVALIPRKVMSR
jgi:tetratricopeptide (TPR) repeat protein